MGGMKRTGQLLTRIVYRILTEMKANTVHQNKSKFLTNFFKRL